MADPTTTQAPDNPVQFPSAPALGMTHATLPSANPRAGNGSIVGAMPQAPLTSVGPGGRITASGSQGGPSPLMTYLATLMGTGKTDPAATPPPAPPVVSDPVAVNAMAQLHGVSNAAAHAVTEPENHSRDQFIAAMRGVPTNIVNQMVQLRHQWTPQEMAQADYLRELQSGGNPAAMAEGTKALAFMSPYLSSGTGAPTPDLATMVQAEMAQRQQQQKQ